VERGADAVQIQLGDPQSWNKPSVEYPGGAEALRDAAKEAGVGLYVHAPYVINVASANNRLRIPSRKLLQQTVDAAGRNSARSGWWCTAATPPRTTIQGSATTTGARRPRG